MEQKTSFIIGLLITLTIFMFILIILNDETFQNNLKLLNWSFTENEKLFHDLFRDVEREVELWEYRNGETAPSMTEGAIKVQYTAESAYQDPNNFDINFIPVEKESQNVIIFPFAAHYIFTYKHNNIDYLLTKRTFTPKDRKFCLFTVSNPNANDRIEFFHALSNYKFVESCGRHLTNTISSCPGGWGTQQTFDQIANYKFMICFENATQPNYFTEKLINAYSGGAIPIYWGCPNISDYVNMDAFLYLKTGYTEEDRNKLIEEIKYLDENEDAYRAKYESVFFKDGKLPDAFNAESLRQKINERLVK